MTTMQIPISKGKDLFIPFDTAEIDQLPEESYREILFQGLKQVLNRGMSGEGLQSSKGLEGRDLERNQTALMDKAEENLEAVKRGEIRVTGGKAKAKAGSNKALTTEAMRLARLYIKDALKRDGKKVSLISGKEITAAAKALLEDEDNGPEIWTEAEVNLKERAEKEAKISAKINVKGIQEDPGLKAAAEAKKKPKAPKAPVGVVTRARPEVRPSH